MFGGLLKYPELPAPQPRLKIGETGICMPTPHDPGVYAYRGKEPNTDFTKRLTHYKQRINEIKEAENKERQLWEKSWATKLEHQNYGDKRRFRAKIFQRLQEKLDDYEADLNRRRDKLRDLLSIEEEELIRDTVYKHQNADNDKIEQRRKQCEMVRNAEEAQRLELVRQKRLQQYAARAMDLRPMITKKRLIESKDGQLQQMRENESKREVERELDKLWVAVRQKQDEALLERETHDAILRHNARKKDLEILNMQVLAKKALEEERKEIERSNREEMQKLIERIKREEQEEFRTQRARNNETAAIFQEQIRLQAEFAAERKRKEQALDRTLMELTELELAREKSRIVNKTSTLKRETALYREHIAELEQIRKDEEKKLDQLLIEVRTTDQRKQDERRCKIEEARYSLQKKVLEGRAKQLEYKKLQAEKDLQCKKDQSYEMNKFIEKNKILDAEARRLEVEAARQYRDDLKKQMEYSKLIRERELREMEEKLKKCVEAEESFKREVTILMEAKTMSALHAVHPFRAVIERFDCHCPENVVEKK